MKPASISNRKSSRWIALILIAAILAPSTGIAQPKQPASDVMRARVLKIGVGNWVRVREQSGVNLNGQITGIGPQVFQMERPGAAAPTTVYYADVSRIHCAHSPADRTGLSPNDWAGIAAVGAIFLFLIICTAEKCTKSAAQASW